MAHPKNRPIPLNAGDMAVLLTLEEMEPATSHLMETAMGMRHTGCQETLRRLCRLGLAMRKRAELPTEAMLIKPPRKMPFEYTLTPRGVAVVEGLKVVADAFLTIEAPRQQVQFEARLS